jgi:hypothetical protein
VVRDRFHASKVAAASSGEIGPEAAAVSILRTAGRATMRLCGAPSAVRPHRDHTERCQAAMKRKVKKTESARPPAADNGAPRSRKSRRNETRVVRRVRTTSEPGAAGNLGEWFGGPTPPT